MGLTRRIMNYKNLFVYTIGCQMNVYDSEQMVRALAPLGYAPALSAEAGLELPAKASPEKA